ncbi:MAG: AAA family ATPase [Synergistaceae bacterium]|jgi:DNA repair protein RecN (Recombination protein N)|nr:AAA family ATPase [Synergistaceae bacterium]
MIDELRVRGIGGVDEAAMLFSGDFIVITGESGAGKSSIVRAFEFASGRRALSSIIRASCDEACAEAVWGEDRMGEKLITKRSLSRSGKSRCFIHGELSTVGQLSEISSRLIEIQSQFSQLNLLEPSRQLDLVDATGGAELEETKRGLAELFPGVIALEREILDLKKRQSALETELEGAPARVRQIKSLSPYQGCEKEWGDELAATEKQLADVGRYDDLLRRMTGGEGGDDFIDSLDALMRDLYRIAPPESKDRWEELGERALSSLQELFASARSELGMAPREEIEARHDAAESKIGMLRRVKRETGLRTEDDLLSYINDVEENMRWLKESRGAVEEMQSRALAMRTETGALARKLRALRERAAADFAERVNGHLADLAMEETIFSAEIERHDVVRASGAEGVVFMLARNGLSSPVSRVASGGELSRILIAIQASMDHESAGALVFDEVEAGLGGRTALLAGKKLRELSRRCRIILVTHEATIAAMAVQHFVVRREGDRTDVFEIKGEERAREIARMLAGSESSEAMEHAKALLRLDDPERSG